MSSSSAKEPRTQARRLIVCCDGTANDVDRDSPLTNVARISRCISPEDRRGEIDFTQIVYYLPGVGTGTSWAGNKVDGLVGRGSSHIPYASVKY